MKAERKKRRSRIVPKVIFCTVCVGVVPATTSSCIYGLSVAEQCFTDAGKTGPCVSVAAIGFDAGPDAGDSDAGRGDAG
jgi:hypothetical protein